MHKLNAGEQDNARIPFVIYHANCADGFTAAWAVSKAYPDAEFFAANYGEAPPKVIDRDVIIVDFSYKKAMLEKLMTQAKSLILLDHHQTAEADLKSFKHQHATVVFDMNRSGAGIAWDFFQVSKRKLLIDYVEDRDLWHFKLPHSREINSFIFSHEYTFENWDMLDHYINHRFEVVVESGTAIERKHFKDIAELLKATERRMTIGGYNVPVANMPYTLSSDAANIMAVKNQAPFAACYMDGNEGVRTFSLRSNKDGIDVSKIAQQYGGGGHCHAAGFRRPIGWEGE